MAELSFIRISPPFQPTKLTITNALTITSNLKLTTIHNQKLPARDIPIDFGKHRGKMLGTLPSTYLQWVSNNLRARDFEQWAKLADDVLSDPVYRDRIEWEFAQKILTGTGSYRGGSVSELLEISERFGWDNEDKVAWKKVDFELLGTSKGGRIPRVCAKEKAEKDGVVAKTKRVGSDGEECGKRKERRERGKKRREGTSFDASGTSGRSDNVERKGGSDTVRSPFPGREGLLKKVLNRERLI